MQNHLQCTSQHPVTPAPPPTKKRTKVSSFLYVMASFSFIVPLFFLRVPSFLAYLKWAYFMRRSLGRINPIRLHPGAPDQTWASGSRVRVEPASFPTGTRTDSIRIWTCDQAAWTWIELTIALVWIGSGANTNVPIRIRWVFFSSSFDS